MSIERIQGGEDLAQSKDMVKENLAKLMELFPEVSTEGKVDFDVLRAIMGEEVETGEEFYRFTWAGKTQARREAHKPSTGTLRPCPEESLDWENTKNLYIEGDNLEVLKLLQKSYGGKVKMIYIDPPYNTGKDFVYKDNYRDNLRNYKEQTGQVDSDGNTLSTNSDADGRYHSNWLNMMYPRLRLARNLLREDGVIFISIDDSEVDSLKKACNELFGEENFLVSLIYDKNRKNDAKYFSVGHEYMVAYFKNANLIRELGLIFRSPKEGVDSVRKEFLRLRDLHNDHWDEVQQGIREFYKSWDKDDARQPLSRFVQVDEHGPYRDDGNISWPGGGGPKYQVLHPLSGKPCKVPDGGWRFPKEERMLEEIQNGRVVFGDDETTLPRIRRNLFEADREVLRSVKFSYAQTATLDFMKLFDNQRVFENPKNPSDIAELVRYVTDLNSDEVILDFFSGSGSTAHAVMQLNAEDGGQRRHIQVQLPEPTDAKSEAHKAGYKTIAAIGKERIGRAGKKVVSELEAEIKVLKAKKQRSEEEEQALQDKKERLAKLDIGFKVFKLDSSNIKAWDGDPERMEENLLSAAENIKPDRTEADVLYEVLLKYGLDLTLPIEERTIAKKQVFNVGMGAIFLCLSEGITNQVAEGIGQWKEELNPETCRVIFRDNGFTDVEKTNAAQTLKRYGVTEVRSV